MIAVTTGVTTVAPESFLTHESRQQFGKFVSEQQRLLPLLGTACKVNGLHIFPVFTSQASFHLYSRATTSAEVIAYTGVRTGTSEWLAFSALMGGWWLSGVCSRRQMRAQGTETGLCAFFDKRHMIYFCCSSFNVFDKLSSEPSMVLFHLAIRPHTVLS